MRILMSARGQIWSRKKKYEKSIADLTAAIKLRPNDAKLYHYRGYTWQCMRKCNLADDDYSNAIRLGLKDADVFADARANCDLQETIMTKRCETSTRHWTLIPSWPKFTTTALAYGCTDRKTTICLRTFSPTSLECGRAY